MTIIPTKLIVVNWDFMTINKITNSCDENYLNWFKPSFYKTNNLRATIVI